MMIQFKVRDKRSDVKRYKSKDLILAVFLNQKCPFVSMGPSHISPVTNILY